MVSSGPLYPGTVATEVGPSGDSNWTSASNVGADDGSQAQITASTYDAGDHSYRLKATNFGFSIPSGATIDGILVEIDRRDFAGDAQDQEVRLYDSTGTLVGSDKQTADSWPTTSAIASYGGAADTWTAGLDVADVNSSAFGVALIVLANSANTDIGVDFIRVTVTYTEAAPFGTAASTFPFSTAAEGTAAGAAGGSYYDEVLADSPVAYYRMGEPSGAVLDEIGTADGTVSGTVTRDVTGLITDDDGAIDFAGGGHVGIPWPSGTTQVFTVEAMIKVPSSASAWRSFLGTDEIAFSVERTTLRLIAYRYDSAWDRNVQTADNAVATNGTYHVVWTRAGTTNTQSKLYIDGVDVSNYTGTSSGTIADTATDGFIGAFDASNEPWLGLIDEFAIYDYELSAAQVAAHNDARTVSSDSPSGTAASTFPFSTAADGAAGSSGTAASTFPFSTEATAVEDIPGVIASTFPFSTEATAVEDIPGVIASTFPFSTEATAVEDIPGSAASTFPFSTEGEGTHTEDENTTGVAASTFPFSTEATAVEDIPGSAASTFPFSTEATAVEDIPGVAASTFPFSTEATAVEDIPGVVASTFPFSTAATGSAGVSGTSAVAFSWLTSSEGAMREALTGVGGVVFGWSTAGVADAIAAFGGDALSPHPLSLPRYPWYARGLRRHL